MVNLSKSYEVEGGTGLQAAIKAGIIVGPVLLAIYYVAYFMEVALLSSSWLGLVMFGLALVLVMYFSIALRNDLGGFMSFTVAFQFVFITFVISGFISTIGNMLLFHVIDPALPVLLADAQMENTLAILDKIGAGSQLSSKQLAEMQTDLEKGRSLIGLAQSYGISLIIYAIISLILGAIVKKRDKTLHYQ
ncbi:DUF4199 domain-containing protein [Anditalea andensis]|uniref:DUF4199 domain-containing protein n=1 Tax=Anditalea andensis TaxID=1048983 RepID=A0A074KZI2_9BACT|nr:DUF4199 domain-containing protein [Anditalea andensis]KEO74334.1 hypothetical protein EL17_06250 [Anditalea andensis]